MRNNATIRAIIALLLFLGACTSSLPSPDLPAAPPEQIITASLPYLEPRTDLPVVHLEIEGRGTFSFIIDTGANSSAVYIGSESALGVERLKDENMTIRGLTDYDTRPVGKLSGLKLGADSYDDMTVVILEPRPRPPDADGILGTDILRNYALLFDPILDKVLFISAESFDTSPYATWDKIPIAELDGRNVTQNIWFGRAPIVSQYVPVLIDTGADFSVMNWEAARLMKYLDALYKSMWEKQTLQGATGTTRPSLNIIAAGFRIGGHKWGSPRFIILDLDTLAILVGDGNPLVIAGADMFATRRYAIDFLGGMIYIDPNGPHLKYEEGASNEAPSSEFSDDMID